MTLLMTLLFSHPDRVLPALGPYGSVAAISASDAPQGR